MIDEAEVESTMLRLVARLGEHSSACPSQVARALSDDGWRELMPLVRKVALKLRQQGLVDISQSGVSVLNLEAFSGPIRLRQPRPRPANPTTGETP